MTDEQTLRAVSTFLAIQTVNALPHDMLKKEDFQEHGVTGYFIKLGEIYYEYLKTADFIKKP